MASSTISKSSQFSEDRQIWDSLKQAIASSSGFERWQIEHPVEDQLKKYNLDTQVRLYLRETLETLAY
ncbi:MAG: hypothetical protein F6K14_18390 [Symploca sp. SIO2C1]|nr:hypothetical protein [Symploca sp. SIO2C1]